MTQERMQLLMSDEAELTEAEIAERWHFCYECDGLLRQPNSDDGNGLCYCFDEVKD